MAALTPGPEHAKKQEEGTDDLPNPTHVPRLSPGRPGTLDVVDAAVGVDVAGEVGSILKPEFAH